MRTFEGSGPHRLRWGTSLEQAPLPQNHQVDGLLGTEGIPLRPSTTVETPSKSRGRAAWRHHPGEILMSNKTLSGPPAGSWEQLLAKRRPLIHQEEYTRRSGVPVKQPRPQCSYSYETRPIYTAPVDVRLFHACSCYSGRRGQACVLDRRLPPCSVLQPPHPTQTHL